VLENRKYTSSQVGQKWKVSARHEDYSVTHDPLRMIGCVHAVGVRRWTRQRGRAIYSFRVQERRPADIEKLTPRASAHVLITTRWSDWFGFAEALPVDIFSPEVAIDYLMARARESAVKPAETRAAAARLAQDLGYLPLAIAIARAQSWGMGWSFDQYRDHLAAMLKRAPTSAVDYPHSVFATFTLALEKAVATAPEAEKLLGIAAYLAPDRIPLDIIKTDVMSEIERGEAVAALSEVSLVTLETLDDNSKGFSVHRLLQSVMSERLRARGEEFAALVTRLVADAYPSGMTPLDVRFWPACRRLEGHVIAALAVAPGRTTHSAPHRNHPPRASRR
jgi:hypothetical protein